MRPARLGVRPVFASFGLFVGYLLPSENVMQILGFALMLLSFAGGLFIPASRMGDVMGTIAQFTSVYDVVTIPLPLTRYR